VARGSPSLNFNLRVDIRLVEKIPFIFLSPSLAEERSVQSFLFVFQQMSGRHSRDRVFFVVVFPTGLKIEDLIPTFFSSSFPLVPDGMVVETPAVFFPLG